MDVVFVFNDNGFAFGLTFEADDFGMANLAIDDDLSIGVGGVGLMDFLLQFEHYGTSGIDDSDVVALC